MANKIKLRSDFRDYYDHAFDNTGDIFCRLSKSGKNRIEMLNYLSELGLKVPRFGIARKIVPELLDEIFPDTEDNKFIREKIKDIFTVVRHNDIHAHRGEGKELVTFNEALKTPEAFCVEFIPVNTTGLGESFRYLQVGNRKWWLKFTSKTDWRSNNGDVEIEILGEERIGYHPRIKDPLFAIDFVMSNHMYAIDFNISPGLGEEFESIIKPTEVYELIKSAFNR